MSDTTSPMRFTVPPLSLFGLPSLIFLSVALLLIMLGVDLILVGTLCVLGMIATIGLLGYDEARE